MHADRLEMSHITVAAVLGITHILSFLSMWVSIPHPQWRLFTSLLLAWERPRNIGPTPCMAARESS
jgi:hypothetical protein